MHAPRFTSAFRSVVLGFIVALAALAAPNLAVAGPKGDQATVDKVTNLNKKALEAYSHEDFDTARSLLKEALELCANAGLDQHPITARTHIHFGAVAIVGFKQREVGIKQFRKALDIQPDIKLTKVIATPELQDAFEEAVLAGEGGGSGGQAAAGGGGPSDNDEGGGQRRGAAPQQAEDNGEGESTPPPRRPKPPPRKKHGGDEDEDEKDEGAGAKRGNLFVGVWAGTGFGLVSGHGEVDPNHKLGGAGFAAPQSLVLTPEFGYFVTPQLLVSGAVRFQYLVGLTGEVGSAAGCGSDMFCDPYSTAWNVLAKVTYYLGTEGVRFAIGGQIGGGTGVRNAVAFNDVMNCKASASSTTMSGCVDTLKGGPFLIGPTLGAYFEVASVLDLFIGLNTELGLPSFTYNIDLQGGLALRL
jgi:hypothetical protein